MVSTGSLEIEHGDANEGVELLKQALKWTMLIMNLY